MSPQTFQDEESINLSKVNPSQYKFIEEESKVSFTSNNRFFNHNEGVIVNCEDEIVSSEYE